MSTSILSRLMFAAMFSLALFNTAIPDVFAADIVIVANEGVPSNTLTQSLLKNIFMGKKTTWDNGQKIEFVILEDSDAHKTFLKKYLQKSSSQFMNHWKRQVFTGKGRLPKRFATEESLVNYVAGKDGAIGYVLSGTNTSKAKIIGID